MRCYNSYNAWLLPQTQVTATGNGNPGSPSCLVYSKQSYLDVLKQQLLPAELLQLLPDMEACTAESAEQAAFRSDMQKLNERLRGARQQLRSLSQADLMESDSVVVPAAASIQDVAGSAPSSSSSFPGLSAGPNAGSAAAASSSAVASMPSSSSNSSGDQADQFQQQQQVTVRKSRQYNTRCTAAATVYAVFEDMSALSSPLTTMLQLHLSGCLQETLPVSPQTKSQAACAGPSEYILALPLGSPEA
jgi:hypothetical protein